MTRRDGRTADQIRPIEIQRRFTTSSPGSVLYRAGNTHVFVTATVEERVPKWMSGRGAGWVTAEYAMLPGSTGDRKARDRGTGRVDGRTMEIQRLVGRALRAVVDMAALGERTIWLDCDVLQADGGTRTACVNAAYIALCDALKTHEFRKPLARWPIHQPLGAMSVGIVGGTPMVDLDYSEDHRADVDMNLVMTAGGEFLELQGTGESRAFTGAELEALLALGRKGVTDAVETARAALAAPLA
ncbi:MAG: ribonuclease PH [Planctomycetota bacterium]|nr:ribonuclease PH [Planctomycetota bacterium]